MRTASLLSARPSVEGPSCRSHISAVANTVSKYLCEPPFSVRVGVHPEVDMLDRFLFLRDRHLPSTAALPFQIPNKDPGLSAFLIFRFLVVAMSCVNHFDLHFPN